MFIGCNSLETSKTEVEYKLYKCRYQPCCFKPGTLKISSWNIQRNIARYILLLNLHCTSNFYLLIFKFSNKFTLKDTVPSYSVLQNQSRVGWDGCYKFILHPCCTLSSIFLSRSNIWEIMYHPIQLRTFF